SKSPEVLKAPARSAWWSCWIRWCHWGNAEPSAMGAMWRREVGQGVHRNSDLRTCHTIARNEHFALVPKLRLGMQSSELRSARPSATLVTRPVFHASGRHADGPVHSPLGCEA